MISFLEDITQLVCYQMSDNICPVILEQKTQEFVFVTVSHSSFVRLVVPPDCWEWSSNYLHFLKVWEIMDNVFSFIYFFFLVLSSYLHCNYDGVKYHSLRLGKPVQCYMGDYKSQTTDNL